MIVYYKDGRIYAAVEQIMLWLQSPGMVDAEWSTCAINLSYSDVKIAARNLGLKEGFFEMYAQLHGRLRKEAVDSFNIDWSSRIEGMAHIAVTKARQASIDVRFMHEPAKIFW